MIRLLLQVEGELTSVFLYFISASRESRKSSGGTSIASSASPRNPAVANLVADASSRLKKHAQKNNLRLQIPGKGIYKFESEI